MKNVVMKYNHSKHNFIATIPSETGKDIFHKVEKFIHFLEREGNKILFVLVNCVIKYNMGSIKRSCETLVKLLGCFIESWSSKFWEG